MSLIACLNLDKIFVKTWQNILGEQASVRLSQDEDESQNTDILVKEVELAALYLCPATSGK